MYPSFAKTILVVSYGAGVDSTMMLLEMKKRGMRPAIILFADTGGERWYTYLQVWRMQAWCEANDFPSITVVRYAPVRAAYTTLEGKCLANEGLPSLATGGHSCSLVFKRDPQNAYLKRELRAFLRDGGKIIKAIGYDASARDCKRAAKSTYAGGKAKTDTKDAGAKWEHKHVDSFWYPLQEWGIAREACEAGIAAAGLPAVRKSSCWFCPASQLSEVIGLMEEEPELYARAVMMEDAARDGKHAQRRAAEGKETIPGLGRTWAWGNIGDAMWNQLLRAIKDAARAKVKGA